MTIATGSELEVWSFHEGAHPTRPRKSLALDTRLDIHPIVALQGRSRGVVGQQHRGREEVNIDGVGEQHHIVLSLKADGRPFVQIGTCEELMK